MKIKCSKEEAVHFSHSSQLFSAMLVKENPCRSPKLCRRLSIVVFAVSLFSFNQFSIAQVRLLRDKMESMDVVAIAKLVNGTQTDNDAEFELTKVVRGHKLIHPSQRVCIDYVGKNLVENQFLLVGIAHPTLLWCAPLPANERAIAYFDEILQLPADPVKRLEFYLSYLENEDKLLARDAFTALASASYEQWVKLKPKLNHDKLIAWVSDVNVSPFRKDLYFVLLGILRKNEDHKLLEAIIRNEDPKTRNCLTAAIIAYVFLRGDEGLDVVDGIVPGNEKCDFITLFGFCRALRFLGGTEGIVRRERVVKSLRLILQHPLSMEIPEEVISQLAARADWSQLDRLVELFKSADKDHLRVRIIIFDYLRGCPVPEAIVVLQELKKIDPRADHLSLKFFGGVDPQKRIVQCTNSWDLWDIFAPTSRDWDMYD